MFQFKREEQKQSNPCRLWMQWKSNNKKFCYWDKANEKEVDVSLPLKFVILEHYHTVKGWNDASNSGIASNEVFFINEPLEVYSFKGGEIAKGPYKEIKADINAAGGYYARSIYIMLNDGRLANMTIKGSVVSSYSNFIAEHKAGLADHWIEIKKAKENKKGSISYSVPEFSLSDSLVKEDYVKIKPIVEELSSYMQDYLNKPKPKETPPEQIDLSDLPF